MKSEFEITDAFLSAFPRPHGGLVLGAGDDCALLRPPADEELVLTTDALVEGVHFSAAFSAREIGHKALAVNLSDLAAMGSKPMAFLCALAFPPRWVRKLPEIARGMARLAGEFQIQLAGGNVSRAGQLSITIAAIGSVPKGLALRRTGARVGDRLLVSGALGGAAAGRRKRALRPFQRLPMPRIALGLAARKLAHAAIDISDGLAQDLSHVLDASGVGAKLSFEKIPVVRGAALDDALFGGEDYELLLAVPPGRVAALLARSPCALTEIGEVIRGRGIEGLPGGRSRGFLHFGTRTIASKRRKGRITALSLGVPCAKPAKLKPSSHAAAPSPGAGSVRSAPSRRGTSAAASTLP